jgi:uncharacterized OB-fold protein
METHYIAELPQPTLDSQAFWDGCQRQQLLLQHCGSCQHVFYYARRLCPACGSTELSWQASSGRGTLYSASQVQVAFQGPHWQSQLPYTVVLVDLEEGPRMLSRWAGGPEHRPQMGQRVRVRFVQVQQEQWLPFFEPDECQRA